MSINVKQPTELHRPSLIVYHQPYESALLGSLHPAGSLFQNVTSGMLLQSSFVSFRAACVKHGIKAIDIKEILLGRMDLLRQFAKKLLKYEADPSETEKLRHFLSDQYRLGCIDKMDGLSLLQIVFGRPTIHIKFSEVDTGCTVDHVKLVPVVNSMFCRDAQIITAKGLVMTRMESEVRKFQTEIFKLVWKSMDYKIIGQTPEDCQLEGGDFMTVKPDLALLGIGVRSNRKGGQFLMDNDLLGTGRFALIEDVNDHNQQRMHLDTYFNLINKDTVMLLDFQTVPQTGVKKDLRRIAHVYERRDGKYTQQRTVEFSKFLEDQGFKIVWVTHEQQLAYLINFIIAGENLIFSGSKLLRPKLEKAGLKVTIEQLDFEGVNRMYGSVHCATQIIRQ